MSYNILIKKLSSYRSDIVLIAVLIAMVSVLASQIFPTHNSTLYRYDDTEFMNVAYNMLEGHGFVKTLVYPVSGFWGNGLFTDSYDPIIILKTQPSLYQPFNISPLFFLIFAGYLGITKANPTNWVLIGSIFNITVFSIFTSLYFLWARRHFGRIISFVSSVIIICTPTFLIHLTLVEMYPLGWLFILLSFYFIKKTRKDYVLFGIFSAFAVLSNQTGIIAIIAYATFLILKKELRGLSYVLGAWFVTVLPWMIYSLINFGDPASGLGIPFSSNISSIIDSFLSHHQIISSVPLLETIHPGALSLPFDVFRNTLYFETNVSFMVIIILFFSCVAFVSLVTLKKITRKTAMLYGALAFFISIGIIFYYYSVGVQYNTNLWNYVVQGLILFGVPTLTGALFWLKKDVFLEKNIPRLYLIILFVALHTLLAIYYLGITWVGFDEKYVWPLFFLMLPLGIYGISKIIHLFHNRIFSNSKIVILLIPLILAPFLITMYDTTFLQEKSYRSEVSYPKDIAAYVLQHFDRNTVIATQYPGPFFLATGNSAVAMQDFEPFNFSAHKKFVTTYGVEYFVLQRQKDDPAVLKMSLTNEKYDIGPNSYFPAVFASQESNYVIFSRLICENPANNMTPENNFEYGLCLEKLGNAGRDANYHNEAAKAFNSYKPVVGDSTRNLNLLLYLGWRYDDNYAIKSLAEKQILTNGTGVPLELIQKILNLTKDNVTKQFELSQTLESKQSYPQAIDAYQQILQIDPYNKKASDAIFRLYSNNGTQDLLQQYQQFEQQMNQTLDFEIYHHSSFNIKNNMTEQTYLIKNQIKVWQHYHDDNKVFDLYTSWYKLNPMDSDAVAGYADYSLKLHKPLNIDLNLLLDAGWKYNNEYVPNNSSETQISMAQRLDLESKILPIIKDNVTKQFELSQNLESKQSYPQAIDAYQQILQIDPYNKKASDAIFRLYSNNGTQDLLQQYQQFEQQMNQILDFEITHRDTFNIQNLDNERINLLKNEIKVWQHYQDDNQLIVLYQNWYEIDQFSVEANEGYADLSLKLNQDKGITIDLYEHLLQLVSGEKQKEIQTIIDSLKK